MRRLVALLPLAAVIAVVAVVPMPMFSVSPGPARDVEPLIRVGDRQVFASEGRFLLTTVTLRRPTMLEAVAGWLDDHVDVVPERQVLPPGVTEEEDEAIQRSRMDESKLAAAYAALERVTRYPEARRPGAIVQRVFPGTPADGRVFPGDVVISVDGRPVPGPDMVARRIRQAGDGGSIELVVRAGGERRSVRLRPRWSPQEERAIIGVTLIENFPFPLTIESGDIGGPSAGLMWAIGLVDLLTPGDLAGGRRIAGTGTIALDGTVGPIGGIGQKIVAADRAGAAAFLVPRGDVPAARAARASIELIPIDDLDDALRYLTTTCNDCGGL